MFFSIYPALSHFLNIAFSIGIWVKSHEWEIASKQPLMSPSSTHCAEGGIYAAAEMARSFRTVRSNTILVAEDIPEEQYKFSPAPGVRTVAETLAHIAVLPNFAKDNHSSGITVVTMEHFGEAMQKLQKQQAALVTKAQILDGLKTGGEEFAGWLEKQPDEMLEEVVTFQPPIQMPPRSRFDMLLGVKEHEMHHRAQLMLVERILGITPHLTRQQQERMAAMQQQTASAH